MIRQELARGRPRPPDAHRAGRARPPPREVALRGPGSMYWLEDVLEETGADQSLVKELEDYGVIKGERRDGEQLYDDTEREIIRAVTELEALRRGRAQPARLPHVGRPRGGAAGADPRAGPAVAKPRAPQGGGRGAREPGGDRVASQAPAADPRPAQARALTLDLDAYIGRVPDFPKPGILFYDITTLFLEPAALRETVDRLADYARSLEVDYVVSAEARGFVLGGAVARRAGAGFILARKPGKLPREVARPSTSSSTASTRSRCTPTRSAAAPACWCTTTCWRPAAPRGRSASWWSRRVAVVAGCAFVIELAFLGGRERLAGYDVHSLLVLRRRVACGARRSCRAPRSRTVWGVGRDPARLPRWWPGVTRVEEATAATAGRPCSHREGQGGARGLHARGRRRSRAAGRGARS